MTTKNEGVEVLLDKLEKIIAYFDDEHFDLDKGMTQYDEAVKLVEKISQKVAGYEVQIEEKRQALAQALKLS